MLLSDFFFHDIWRASSIKVKTNKYGESALHVAIKKGDYDKAKNLLDDSAADVNMKDNAGGKSGCDQPTDHHFPKIFLNPQSQKYFFV